MLAVSLGILQQLKIAKKTMVIGTCTRQRGSNQWNADVHIDNFDILIKNPGISSDLNMNFYARMNTNDDKNFSCGLCVILDKEKITLVRYNGSNHQHKEIKFQFHIHEATVDSINNGYRKSESGNVYVTDRYNNLYQALECLIIDFNISTSSFQKDLFGGLR